MSLDKRFLSITLFLIFALTLLPSKSFSAETIIFGPERFIQEQGKPAKITKTFPLQDATGPFTLIIETGSDSPAISSATIGLNGVTVAGLDVFNQTTRRIRKPVQLQTINTLAVEVHGAPGSSLSVTVFGQTQIRSVMEATSQPKENKKIQPPDRNASLLGPDADGNGVRDDIDQYIEGLPDSPLQKSSLRQLSKAIVRAMQSGENDTSPDLKATSSAIGNAVHCIWDQYDAALANSKVETVRQMTVNTRARLDAYERYNISRSGNSSRLPRGNTCDTH